jgi:glutathione S-transferase
VYQIVQHRIHLLLFGGTPDEAVATASVEKLVSELLPAYEALLSRYRILAGDAVMLVDLAHVPLGVFLALQGFAWLEGAGKYLNVAQYVVSRSV